MLKYLLALLFFLSSFSLFASEKGKMRIYYTWNHVVRVSYYKGIVNDNYGKKIPFLTGDEKVWFDKGEVLVLICAYDKNDKLIYCPNIRKYIVYLPGQPAREVKIGKEDLVFRSPTQLSLSTIFSLGSTHLSSGKNSYDGEGMTLGLQAKGQVAIGLRSYVDVSAEGYPYNDSRKEITNKGNKNDFDKYRIESLYLRELRSGRMSLFLGGGASLFNLLVLKGATTPFVLEDKLETKNLAALSVKSEGNYQINTSDYFSLGLSLRALPSASDRLLQAELDGSLHFLIIPHLYGLTGARYSHLSYKHEGRVFEEKVYEKNYDFILGLSLVK